MGFGGNFGSAAGGAAAGGSVGGPPGAIVGAALGLLSGGGGGLGFGSGGDTDTALQDIRDSLNPTIVLTNPSYNLGQILQIANEGAVTNGGAGVIVTPPLFSGISGGTSLQTPLGGFNLGGNVPGIALLLGGAALVLVFFLRRR